MYQDCFHLIEPLLAKVEKPSRYIDHEWGTLSKSDADYRCCMIYPDVYEVGLPNQGIAILYNILNQAEGISCERGYVPWPDMGDAMREAGIPLLSLEGAAPVASFDIVGMHVPHEMAVTNFLEALDLAGIPLLAADRTEDDPIIIAGGPSVYNPEPYAAFFDAILIGEGEESLLEICQLHRRLRDEGVSRAQIVERLATVGGTYVPSLYEVRHDDSCSPHGYTVPREGKDVPPVVYKRVVEDFGATNPLSQSCVPYAQLVHDRLSIEILRGCARGCRFCQAGFIYRPIREKHHETINRQAKTLCDYTGYNEISLTSLSTSDYTEIQPLLSEMIDWTRDRKINISLPSLRVDNFSDELVEKLKLIRKSGLTFAPEAGSQRLRDAINKNITEEEILGTARLAFKSGWTTVKLYFMLGLPTETQEDIEAIITLSRRIVSEYYRNPDRPKGRALTVNVSASSFVPKPHTPFQWEPQDTREELTKKRDYLREQSMVPKSHIHLSAHKIDTVFLEAVFARGDRRLGEVMLKAFSKGVRLDSWDECFDFDAWMEAFDECGVSPEFYANRRRSFDEVLPWDHLDYGITKDFLMRENKKAYESITTPHCRIKCAACGAAKLNGGECGAKC